MIIKSVRLRNFGVFEDHTVDFSPRMNLIVGKCGSGKSTIINAVKLALTGEYFGVKEENVRQLKPETEKSFVELKLEHAGLDVYVKRNVCSSGVTLKINGEKQGRNIEEVNSILWDLLDTNKDKISNYVFSDQECVKGVLGMRPSARKTALLKLFGVTKAADIYKSLGDYANKITVPTSGVDADLLAKDIEDLTAEIATIDVQFLDLAYDEKFVTDRVKSLQKSIDAIAVHRKFLPLKEAKELEIAALVSSIEELQKAAADKRAEIDKLTGSLKDASMDVEIADSVVSVWATIAKNQSKFDALVLQEKEDVVSLTKLNRPAIAALSVGELQKYEKLQSDLGNYKNELAKYASLTNDDSCPACGLTGGDIEKHAIVISDTIAVLAPVVNVLAARKTEWDAYADAKTSLQKQLKDVRNSLSVLDFPPQPEMSKEKSAEITSAVGAVKSCLLSAAKALAVINSSLENAELNKLKAEKELANYLTELDVSVVYTDEIADGIVSERDNLLQVRVSYNNLVLERTKLNERLNANTARLQDHQAVLAQAKRVHAAKASLAKIRDVFHYDNVPRMVSYRYLEHLQDKVNNVLALFDAEYRVEPDDSLGFTATFLDGSRSHSASRLSVGQQIELAISFRVAVNSTFASSLSVLSMDEPTAYLDDDDLDKLPEVFAPLRNVAESQGLQIIVVTHEKSIKHLFDKIIEVV